MGLQPHSRLLPISLGAGKGAFPGFRQAWKWIQGSWDVAEKLRAQGISSQSDLFPGFPGCHDGKMWGNPLLNLPLNPALASSRGISTQSHPRAGCGRPDPAPCFSCLSLSRLGIGLWGVPGAFHFPKNPWKTSAGNPGAHSLARKVLPNPWMLRAFPKESKERCGTCSIPGVVSPGQVWRS